MKQLSFIAVAAACAAAVVIPGTVLSQDAARKVKIDVTSTYPTSLTLVGEAAPKLAKKVLRASGGTIEMKIHEPGALVPGLQAIQAVARGSVDAAWSAPGFFSGTDAVFNLFTTVPFGPGIGEYLAWMYYGGGQELQNEMFAKHDVHAIICGIHSPESSRLVPQGIKSVNDLKGLKMRFFDSAVESWKSSASRPSCSRPATSSRRFNSAPSMRPSSRCRR
jgi:TRAP-type mannitol/chloroaromatic compound transport system substrate-binding protein